MADTNKDKRKALVKQGKEEYVRNNKSEKYDRKEVKQETKKLVSTVKNAPAVKGGTWKKVKSWLF